MISPTSPDDLVPILQQHINALMEHCDAVQILTSSQTETGTLMVNRGGGNWYARQGMAHDFINTDRAQTEAHELSKVLPSHEE